MQFPKFEKIFFMKPLIDKLSKYSLIAVFATLFKVIAFAMAALFVVASASMWNRASDLGNGYIGANGIIYGIIVELLFAGFCLLVANFFWFRSNDIAGAEAAEEYPATPVFSTILRIFGELLFLVAIFLSAIAALCVWFGDRGALLVFDGFLESFPLAPAFGALLDGAIAGAASAFLGGLLVLLYGVVIALLSYLAVGYLSEIAKALPQIARNTRKP